MSNINAYSHHENGYYTNGSFIPPNLNGGARYGINNKALNKKQYFRLPRLRAKLMAIHETL